jgi:hypothetical protein
MMSRRGMIAGLAAVGPAMPAIGADDAELIGLAEQLLQVRKEVNRWDQLTSEMGAKHRRTNPTPEALKLQPGDEALGMPHPHLEDRARVKIMEEYWGHRVRDSEADNAEPKERYYDFPMTIDTLRKAKWPMPIKADLPPGVRPHIVAGAVGEHYVDPSPAARKRADEIIAAYDEWSKRDDALDADPEYEAASEAEDQANYDFEDLESEIAEIRSNSMVGVTAKLKALRAAIYPQTDVAIIPDETDSPLIGSIVRDLFALMPEAVS